MELGARVCTPKSPNCRGCPLREHCLAYKRVAAGGLDGHVKEDREAGSTLWSCTEGGSNVDCAVDHLGMYGASLLLLIADCQLCLPQDEHWDPR